MIYEDEAGGQLRQAYPHLADKVPVNGQAAAYVYRDFSCLSPVVTAYTLLKALNK